MRHTIPATAFFLIVCVRLHAAPADGLPDAEIGGIVINQTFSAAGSAFFREFAVRWNEFDTRGRYNLSLIERPERRGGSRVWIELDGQPVAVVPMSPGRAAPAQAAVEAVFNRAFEMALAPPADPVSDRSPLEPANPELL